MAKSTIMRFSFFFFFDYLVIWPKLDDPFVSQNPREVFASHSSERILSYICSTWSYDEIQIIIIIIPCKFFSSVLPDGLLLEWHLVSFGL